MHAKDCLSYTERRGAVSSGWSGQRRLQRQVEGWDPLLLLEIPLSLPGLYPTYLLFRENMFFCLTLKALTLASYQLVHISSLLIEAHIFLPYKLSIH